MEKNAYRTRTATTTPAKMPAARLRLRMSAGFHFVFCSSSGSRRLSTKRTIGFSRNAITTPKISGSKIVSSAVSMPKKPGRSVKITTRRMLTKMTTSAVRPHLTYGLFRCSFMAFLSLFLFAIIKYHICPETSIPVRRSAISAA